MSETEDNFGQELAELREKFAIEAEEKIAALESAALTLEDNPTEMQQVELLFGAMHTLKGSGGMFGYDKISEFTHNLETLYDYVRKGKLEVTTELLTITLQAIDHLKVLLAMGDNLDPATEATHKEKTKHINEFAEKKISNIKATQPAVDATVSRQSSYIEQEEGKATYFISFKPHENIFDNGPKPLYLIDEIHSLGDAFIIPHTDSIPPLENFNPLLCYTWWEIFLSTDESPGTIADIFIFVEDESQIVIQKVADDNLFDFQPFLSYLRFLKSENELADLKKLKKIIDELPARTEPESVQNPVIDEAPIRMEEEIKAKQEPPRARKTTPPVVAAPPPIATSKAAESTISSIRVSADKVDKLMNLVSEMVTVQARLTMYAEQSNNLELISIAENVQKLSKQLRDNAFSISLIPIASVMTRFQRLVRDLSASLGKKVKFVVEGQETELDKTIIERISDPLLHILRNSLDHGIEKPEERVAAGKPEEGTINFKASYSGGNIHIEIKDDGGGIDKERVIEKAISNNLISPNDSLSDKEIFNLIFAPGFSTAKVVSGVSGRGVGMDVVRKKISEIRGDVVITSEKGVGTSITIILPLTLSIIDGMQVKIGTTSFIIPTSSVHKIYSVKHQDVEKAFDNLMVLDGRQVPCFNLRQQFSLNGPIPNREEVLVVKYENLEVGLIIDKVVGEFQTVLKPLGMHYKSQEYISGGTILGDGSVALVLDTHKIISKLTKELKK
jgi:two-component system chemotaxis sensor kinase CheA